MEILLLKIFLTSTIVLILSLISEKFGARIGAIAAGFPTGVAIISLFLGIEQGSEYLIQTAPHILAGFFSIMMFCLGWVLSGKFFPHPRLFSPLTGFLFFISSALLLTFFQITFLMGTIIGILSLLIFSRIFAHLQNNESITKKPLTLSEFLFRISLATVTVVVITELPKFFDSGIIGVFTIFPVNLLPLLLILHRHNTIASLNNFIVHFPQGLVTVFSFALALPLLTQYFPFLFAWFLAFLPAILILLITFRKTEGKAPLLITRFPLESGWGGEEKLHLVLAQRLREEGKETCIWSSDHHLRKGFSQKGFSTFPACCTPDPTSKKSLLLSPITSILLFLQALLFLPYFRLRGVQSILMLTFFEKILLTPFALLFGFRVTWGHHTQVGKWLTKNPLLFFWKLWSKWVTIVVPSTNMKNALQKIQKSADIQVVSNAIPFILSPISHNQIQTGGHDPLLHNRIHELVPLSTLKKNLKISPNSLIIGSAGRLSREKHFEEFLSLAEKYPQHTFLISGEGAERKHLEEMIRQKKLKNIHLLGFLDETQMSEFFASLDLFCLFSEYESFGLVVAEASASAVPVLAPRVGGIPDIINDKKTGYLFEYGDKKEMEKKFEILLGDPAIRKKMGAVGERYVQKFSVEKYVERMKEILF